MIRYENNVISNVKFSDNIVLYNNSDVKGIYDGDFNADGKSDILVHKASGMSIYSLSTNNTFVKQSDLAIVANTINVIDMNNDGNTDIFDPEKLTIWYVSNNQLTGVNKTIDRVLKGDYNVVNGDYIALTDVGNSLTSFICDANGDGLKDIVKIGNYSSQFYAINLNDSDIQRMNDKIAKIIESRNGFASLDTKIVNEKVVLVTITSAAKQTVLRTPNGGWKNTGITIIDPALLNSDGKLISGDFTGDGVVDIYIDTNRDAEHVFTPLERGFNRPKNHVASITNSEGLKINITNRPLKENQNYSKTSYSGTATNISNQIGLLMVTESVKYTGGDVNDVASYSYKGARIHTAGKGFLGFEGLKIYNSGSGIGRMHTSTLNTSFYTLLPNKTETSANGSVFQTQTLDVTLEGTGKRFFAKTNKTITNDNLTNTTTTVNYSNYDAFGNPKSIVVDYGGGISKTTKTTYVQRGSWCLNKPATITTTNTNTEGSQSRSIHYSYDVKGNLTRETRDPYDENQVMTEYSNHDTFGNPQLIKVTANFKTRSTGITYTSGRFIASQTNVDLNKTVSYAYDESRGLLTSQTDEVGTTSFKYDGFGRLATTRYPNNIETVNNLQWAGGSGPSGAVYYTHQHTSGSSPIAIWYDHWGREIRRDGVGLNNKKMMVLTTYNNKGTVESVSEPYFDSPVAVATYDYDPYCRVISITSQLGNTSYSYSGLTTKVTTPSGITETTLNQAGQVITSKTNSKTVNFTYWPSGLPKTTTPEGGAIINTEYDLQGNRKKIVDPVAGTIEAKTNGLGELLWETRPGSGGYGYVLYTRYDYKQNGLLNSKNINGEVTQYVYDNERNRLKSIEISGKHKQEFAYDDYNRVIEVTERLGTEKVYTTQTEYDAFGRVSKETYPSGYYIINGYDNNGFHTSVKDANGKNIWEAKEANNLGQLTRMMQGGREIVKSYHQGKPTGIASESIIKMSYMFNSRGSLYARADELINNQSELFGNDDKNRLTANDYFVKGAFVKNNSITYDNSTGAIISKSDIGSAMKYGENNLPSGALSSITSNPDIIPDATQSITYTHFNKLATLIEGTNSLTLTYGVDQQRRKGVFNVDGKKLTRYYLGNYEEEVDANGKIRKLHYINTGNGLSAIYEQNGNTNTLYYTYCDYQGNLLVVTDEAFNVVERLAYDPWGARRNPDNWAQADTRTSHLFARGYTLHEHLDGFNLINMNGRVYDPQVARFVSPDPFVQAPGNWLNYDRYAYCMNNPMVYSDPSGYWFESWYDWLNPMHYLGETMDFINGNTVELRKTMTDIGVPDFNVGINSAGNTWHQVGNNAPVYHNQLGNDYEGKVNNAINVARKDYFANKALEKSTSTPYFQFESNKPLIMFGCELISVNAWNGKNDMGNTGYTTKRDWVIGGSAVGIIATAGSLLAYEGIISTGMWAFQGTNLFINANALSTDMQGTTVLTRSINNPSFTEYYGYGTTVFSTISLGYGIYSMPKYPLIETYGFTIPGIVSDGIATGTGGTDIIQY